MWEWGLIYKKIIDNVGGLKLLAPSLPQTFKWNCPYVAGVYCCGTHARTHAHARAHTHTQSILSMVRMQALYHVFMSAEYNLSPGCHWPLSSVWSRISPKRVESFQIGGVWRLTGVVFPKSLRQLLTWVIISWIYITEHRGVLQL